MPLVDVVRVRRRPGPVLALGVRRGPVLADLDGLEPAVVHAEQEGHAVATAGRQPSSASEGRRNRSPRWWPRSLNKAGPAARSRTSPARPAAAIVDDGAS